MTTPRPLPADFSDWDPAPPPAPRPLPADFSDWDAEPPQPKAASVKPAPIVQQGRLSEQAARDMAASGVDTRPNEMVPGVIGPLPGMPNVRPNVQASPGIAAGAVPGMAGVAPSLHPTSTDQVVRDINTPVIPLGSMMKRYWETPAGLPTGAGMAKATTPTPMQASPADQAVLKGVKGASQGVAELAEGLTTPANAGILAGVGALPKVGAMAANTYFNWDMMKAAVESIPEAADAWKRGDTEEAVRMATHALGSGAMSVMGTKHLADQVRPVVEKTPMLTDRMVEASAGRRQEPANSLRDRIASMPDDQLQAMVQTEPSPFTKGIANVEITARKRRNAWKPTPTEAPDRLNRDARRAEAAVPGEDGPTGSDYENAAPDLAGKPWAQLAPEERSAVQQLVDEQWREQATGPGRPVEATPEVSSVVSTNPAQNIPNSIPAPSRGVDLRAVGIAQQLGFGPLNSLEPWQRQTVDAELKRRFGPKAKDAKPAPKPQNTAPAEVPLEIAPALGAESLQHERATEFEPATRTAEPADVSGIPGPGDSREGAPLPVSAGAGDPRRYGVEALVRIPGGSGAYATRYAVREIGEVNASHNPFNFEPNPRYQHHNDRNYSDPRNAERIIRQAQEFDPAYLVADAPDAVNGAPIIDASSNVLGGNSRAMTLQRVYDQHPERAAAYKEMLQKKADQFGIDPAEIAKMDRPILVREIAGEINQQRAITDLNKTGTAALTPSERALTDGKRLSENTLGYLETKIAAQGPDGTLVKALEGPDGAEVINRLVDDGIITPQERGQYIDERGVLTADGKGRVGKLLLGRLFRDSSQFESAPPELRNKLERVVAPLARVSSRPEWDLTPSVQEAIDALQEARSKGLKNLDDLVAQEDLFGGKPLYSAEAIAIAKKLQQGPIKAAEAFKQYANDEVLSRPGQPATMFEPPTREQSFAEAFDVPVDAIDSAASEARARLDSAFKGETLSVNPVGLIGDFAIIGAKHLRDIGRNYIAWARQMLSDFGDRVRPHLQRVWAESQRLLADQSGADRATPRFVRRAAEEVGLVKRNPAEAADEGRTGEEAKVVPIREATSGSRGDQPGALSVSPNADQSWGKLIDKSGLSEEGKLGLIDQVDKYLKANPERKIMSDAEYRDMAKAVDPMLVWGLDPSKITRANLPPREVIEAAVAMKDTVQAEIAKKTAELNTLPITTTKEQLAAKNGEIDKLVRDQQHLLDIIFPVRSEHGRNLRMWKVEAMNNLDPTYWIARAKRAAGVPVDTPLPGNVEPEIHRALGAVKAAEDSAIADVIPKPIKPRVERTTQPSETQAKQPTALTPEVRMEQARKRELARLKAELEGRRLTNPLTPEQRQQLADDPEIKALRDKVHALREKSKPIKSEDQIIADEIARERGRLSRALESDPTTAKVSRLTLEQQKAVEADPVIQSLKARIIERQRMERAVKAQQARQAIPAEHLVERATGRAIDQAEAKSAIARGEEPAPRPRSKFELTPEQRRQVDSDPRVQAARRKLAEIMAETQKSTAWDVAMAFRRANLLTAPATHLRNQIGNAGFQAVEEISRIPAAVADFAISHFGKTSRTVEGANPMAVARASRAMATKGIKEAAEIMRHGATAEQMAAYDFPRSLNTRSQVMNAYVNGVFRSMGAADRMYKVFAIDRSLGEQMRLAKVDTPTESMMARAIEDAEFATFNNDNVLSKIISLAKSAHPSAANTIDLILPFQKTPSNIVLRTLDYTPVGAGARMAGAIHDAFKAKGMTPEMQRRISLAFGRGATGSALLYLGYWMASKGMMTGNRPENPAEARGDEAAGRRWGAVKFGGRWYGVSTLTPIGTLLTTGAALYEASNQASTAGMSPADRTKRELTAMGGAATKTVADMPMLQGGQLVGRILDNPFSSIPNVVGSIASGFVPAASAVSGVAAMFDPVRRQTKADSPGEEIARIVGARLPGVRNMLPERTDVFGDPLPQNRLAAVDPFASQAAKEDVDPLAHEVAAEDMGFGDLKKAPGESEALYAYRKKLLGAVRKWRMSEAVQSSEYQAMPGKGQADDQRRDALRKANRQAQAEFKSWLPKDYKTLSEPERRAWLDNAARYLGIQ